MGWSIIGDKQEENVMNMVCDHAVFLPEVTFVNY